jgi:uncharacterized protein YgbK (DUF1537 family)
MHSPRIALISDDLTGALDAAAPFVGAGLRTLVATTPDGILPALRSMPDVLAVSMNTREGNAANAARIADQVAEALIEVEWVFKKIDSRMKGHIGAESDAIANRRRAARLVVCPAIPEMGRIVRNGRLQGFGVTGSIDVATVSGMRGEKVVFADAESDAALNSLVANETGSTLFVGARGLASALARRFAAGPGPEMPVSLPEPVAISVGSRDPITLAQVERLRRARPDIVWIAAPNGHMPHAAPILGSLVLQATPGDAERSGADVTADLARSFVRYCVDGRASLFLTGGETAAAVLREMRVSVLDLLGEVRPGLPMARQAGVQDAAIIVTKSGGFGDDDVLCQLLPARTGLQA